MNKSHFLIPVLSLLLLLNCEKKAEDLPLERISINPGETSTPISSFIYGQFIEHLGRCIYGGIWAEMLEDRKFYYPVTAEYKPWGTRTDPYWNTGEFRILVASPWMVIGPADAVNMSGINAFTGESDPEISLDQDGKWTGIGQEEMVFEKDREYTGRIYLSGTSTDVAVRIQINSGSEVYPIEEFKNLERNYTRFNFSFSAPADMENARFEIVGSGKGKFRIGTVSLMPADHVSGFNREVLEYLKVLNAPIYRWPGGNFVSGYNWKDGIGDMDKRPPRKNPAWTGIEPNDVGIHEYMKLCDLIGTEPFICVNTGLGTVEEVAEQVEYCNGTSDTPMGKWRKENGREAPFGVTYWAVGNEMYGDWQLGHMPLEEYVKKHNRVAEAMWNVDPEIQLVAVGNVGEWSRNMLSHCSDHMNLISEHIYCKELPDVRDHVSQIPDNIRRVANQHRNYRDSIPGLAGKNIRIAMDEWNYWHGDYLYGELGCRYYMKDALGIAAGFHEYFRNSDLFFMANYAQTVNVIGAIKTTKKDVEFAATGVVLDLYRNNFGTIPVAVDDAPPQLDVSAAIDTVHNLLTVAIVNADSLPVSIDLRIGDGDAKKISEILEVANPDPMAYNAPGEQKMVDIVSREPVSNGRFTIAPYSITLAKMEMP